MRFTPSFFASLTLAGLAASTAFADFDVAPQVSGGKIVTNAFTDEGAAAENNFTPYVANVRVFDFAFDEDDQNPFTHANPPFTQDPGFHPQPTGGANPSSGFTTASSIRVGVLSGLSYFNGVGPVSGSSFAPAPSSTTLSLNYGSTTLVVGTSAPSGTINLGATDANGEFDNHLNATLASSASATALPADGIYLLTAQLSTTGGPTITASNPFYILYGLNADDEEIDAAKVYVRDTYAPGSNLAPAAAPEPGSLVLVSASALVTLAGRRRRVAKSVTN